MSNKKIIFITIFIFVFFALYSGVSFAAQISCSTNRFCKDMSCNTSLSFTFPPGGGTIGNKAFVTLPVGAVISSASVDLIPDPALGKTPYIWIPASTQNKLIQLRISDGSLVRVFSGCGFNNPSRITVINGGDVWVANRGNGKVVRLKLKTGCLGDDCYECDISSPYSTCGSDNRGVTFDSVGNIWAGSNASNCLVRLCGRPGCKDVNGASGYNIGDLMAINTGGSTVVSGINVYGLIGDIYGNVWSSSSPNVRRINIYDVSASTPATNVGSIYGIGIDNEGDIWVGRHGSPDIWEVDGADFGGAGTGVVESKCTTTSTNTGLAVDGLNNVWSTGYSENKIYVVKGGNCAQTFTKTIKKSGGAGICTWTQPHGMAIDSDNHAWLICDTGEAVKFAFHDDGDAVTVDDGEQDIEELQRINLCVLPGVGCGNESGATYNYSDMTGFRTLMSQFTAGSGSTIPVTGTTISGWAANLQTTLAACSCDIDKTSGTGDECYINADGKCVAPLSLSSTIGGTYTFTNLNIGCMENVPDMLGGIVPCGRLANNPSTPYDETQPCTLCHIFIMFQIITTFIFELSAIIAVFFIVIGGLIYATSAGDRPRMEKGKQAVKWAIFGIAIIILSWLMVTITLTALGYINPLGGQWDIVNCAVT